MAEEGVERLVIGDYPILKTGNYAEGISWLRETAETLDLQKVAIEGREFYRPLTLRENVLARVEAYESGDRKGILTETWLDSCTGVLRKASTTRFKILPMCHDFLAIPRGFIANFLSAKYVDREGVELDTSRGKYNQGLTKSEVLEHEGWLAALEGDKHLLKAYADIIYAGYTEKYGKSDSLMGFYVRIGTDSDELRAVFVSRFLSRSLACGSLGLNISCRFLLRSPRAKIFQRE